jgi:hypothetical protein
VQKFEVSVFQLLKKLKSLPDICPILGRGEQLKKPTYFLQLLDGSQKLHASSLVDSVIWMAIGMITSIYYGFSALCPSSHNKCIANWTPESVI